MQSHVMTWTNPTVDSDGNPYDQTKNAGYSIMIDGAPAVSVPLVWGTSFDIGTLAAVQDLKSGPHTAALALISSPTLGGITGKYSPSATFPIFPTPAAPANLAIT